MRNCSKPKLKVEIEMFSRSRKDDVPQKRREDAGSVVC